MPRRHCSPRAHLRPTLLREASFAADDGLVDGDVPDPQLLAEIEAALTAGAVADARWRVLGEINNRLVSRYHPDHLVDWWRQPNIALDGRIPATIASGDFDPDDPMVARLLEVVRAKAEAAPRPINRPD